jgi:hypothetical protein
MLSCYKVRRKREAIRTLPDGRQLCITESGWQRRRKEVYEREQGLCEKCMAYAPLHNTDRAFAGHAHHIEGRKRGDDRLHMLQWICGRCHAVEHQPLKVLPRKKA